MNHPTSRRAFLAGSLSSAALVALSGSVPQFLLQASARAAESGGETILVVVQLTGGNDGLNTVVPYADHVYHKSRPTLGITPARALKIDDYVGLHPSMRSFSRLLQEGRLGIVQGAGYPVPDRSHFSSMDIWQTARRESAGVGPASGATGWLGRCMDCDADGDHAIAQDAPAIHLPAGATRLPLALSGRGPHAISMQSLESFRLEDGGDVQLRTAMRQVIDAPRAPESELVAFLHRGARSALESSRQVQEADRRYKTDVPYPETALATRLKTVAQLIEAGLRTRIYYLDLDGFDTHSAQSSTQPALLAQLSDAVAAFIHDLVQHQHDKRVLVMTFSEFGRRVAENASRGTDHGTAAPMFLAGTRVKPGLLSKHPSMTDLDAGDLKFTTDFRSVYAEVLENWLAVPSEPILGAKFAPLRAIA